MEKHAQEELIVVESDAVGNPWAMMVHFENTSVTLGAMMASVRLRFVAPLTNPYAAKLLFLY